MLPKFCEENVSLKDKNYYQIQGHIRYFLQPKNLIELSQCFHFIKTRNLPWSVIGLGSNSLFSPIPVEGILISMDRFPLGKDNYAVWLGPSKLLVSASLHNSAVALMALRRKLTGGSWLWKMPGLIGASIRMNARCYGHEMSNITDWALSMEPSGHLVTHDKNTIFRGYKKTLYMDNQNVVVAAVLDLGPPGHKKDIIRTMREMEDDRNQKHHFDYPSCGSAFKNNYAFGMPTGQIIERLGMKGLTQGGAQISPYHGNFVWNVRDASGYDVSLLLENMHQKVKETMGLDLELEVEPLGIFPDSFANRFHTKSISEPHKIEKPNKTETTHKILGFHNTEDVQKSSLLGLDPIQKDTLFTKKTLLDGFFMPCEKENQKFWPMVKIRVSQLQSIVNYKNNKPLIRWETLVQKTHLKEIFKTSLTPQHKAKWTDDLWKLPVSELFLCNPLYPEKYAEWEIEPIKHNWLSLKFNGLRKRDLSQHTPTHTLASEETIASGNAHQAFIHSEEESWAVFGFELYPAAVLPYIHSGHMGIQAFISLEEQQYGAMPYWPWKNQGKTDFHLPHYYFQVELT